jgi:hypothetical protein
MSILSLEKLLVTQLLKSLPTGPYCEPDHHGQKEEGVGGREKQILFKVDMC